jgi:hypothetical protein
LIALGPIALPSAVTTSYDHDLPGLGDAAFEELVPTRQPRSRPLGVTDFMGDDFAGKPRWWWSWCRWIFRR